MTPEQTAVLLSWADNSWWIHGAYGGALIWLWQYAVHTRKRLREMQMSQLRTTALLCMLVEKLAEQKRL